MIFTEIDIKDWPRGQTFYYFTKMAALLTSLAITLTNGKE